MNQVNCPICGKNVLNQERQKQVRNVGFVRAAKHRRHIK